VGFGCACSAWAPELEIYGLLPRQLLVKLPGTLARLPQATLQPPPRSSLCSATNYCGTANNAGAILVLGRDLVMVRLLRVQRGLAAAAAAACA